VKPWSRPSGLAAQRARKCDSLQWLPLMSCGGGSWWRGASRLRGGPLAQGYGAEPRHTPQKYAVNTGGFLGDTVMLDRLGIVALALTIIYCLYEVAATAILLLQWWVS